MEHQKEFDLIRGTIERLRKEGQSINDKFEYGRNLGKRRTLIAINEFLLGNKTLKEILKEIEND